MLVAGWIAGAAAAAPDADTTALADAWVHGAGAAELAAADVLVEGLRGDGAVRVLGGRDAVLRLGSRVEIVRDDHRRGPPPGAWHDPDEGELTLRVLAADARRGGLLRFGSSREGRPIGALWLGQTPGSGAPALRVLGAHHGDEWPSFEVAVALASHLAAGDGPDPAVTALLDRATVWIVPYVNPDGVWAGTRLNAAGVDLNRNYDYGWSQGAYRSGPGPFSEPETRAVRAHALLFPPALSVSLHAGSASLGWPWNLDETPPPDAGTFEAIGASYLAGCGAPSFWTAQGSAWYLTFGDLNDWSYGRQGALDLTLELSVEKDPDEGRIDELIGWHLGALLALLDTPLPVAGRVLDEAGAPIPARLVPEIGAPFVNDPVSGAYHRPTGGELRVEAPGYAPATTTGGDVVLARERLSGARVSPRRIAEPVWVAVPGAPRSGTARLLPSDGAPRELEIESGAVRIDPTDLSPGFASLVLPDGTALPRALFVAAPGGAARIDALTDAGDTLRLEGAGLTGGLVFAVVGEARQMLALPSEGSDTELVVDAGALPPDLPFDLLLWADGNLRAVLDVRTDLPVDTGAPVDTGEPPHDAGARACGCGTGAGASGMSALLVLLALPRRRST